MIQLAESKGFKETPMVTIRHQSNYDTALRLRIGKIIARRNTTSAAGNASATAHLAAPIVARRGTFHPSALL